MPKQENPTHSNSILTCKICNFPETISKWIFEESCYILKRSPFLSHISRFYSAVDQLAIIAVGLFMQGPKEILMLKYKWNCIYLWIMTALSFMLGLPYINPSIPVSLCLKLDFGFSRSYRYSVIF